MRIRRAVEMYAIGAQNEWTGIASPADDGYDTLRRPGTLLGDASLMGTEARHEQRRHYSRMTYSTCEAEVCQMPYIRLFTASRARCGRDVALFVKHGVSLFYSPPSFGRLACQFCANTGVAGLDGGEMAATRNASAAALLQGNCRSPPYGNSIFLDYRRAAAPCDGQPCRRSKNRLYVPPASPPSPRRRLHDDGRETAHDATSITI